MKETQQEAPLSAPEVTEEQIAELKTRLGAARREPVFPAGSITACPDCGGKMVTTNDLERTIAVPGLVYVIPRLPGARCLDCGATELDGMGVAILENTASRGIVADYETTVTHSSGTTLGTYFKMDLARVMGLSGDEHLFWKVVDRDRALVQVGRKKGPSKRDSRRRVARSRLATSSALSPARNSKKGH